MKNDAADVLMLIPLVVRVLIGAHKKRIGTSQHAKGVDQSLMFSKSAAFNLHYSPLYGSFSSFVFMELYF